MLSLLNVFAGKKNLNAVLKGVIALVFFSFCGLELLAQPPCNNLSVSLGPNVEYCNGASITLTATITGGPNGLTPIYTWVFDSDTDGAPNVTLSATGNSYTIPSLTNTLDGDYIVTITYSGGSCTTTDSINVDQPNDNISLTSDDDFTICQGAVANINSSVSDVPDGGTVTYSWTSNIGGYTSAVADPSFLNLPSGTYNFTGTATANGCSNNTQIQVTVNNLNLNAGNDQSICQGSAFSIASSISNNPNNQTVTYSWVSNTGNYTATGANPTFNNLPVGTYTFTGTATVNGCTDIDQIQVIVNANPVVPTFTIPANGCPGNVIPISGFTPVAGLTYTWNDDPNSAPNVNGGNTSTPSITLNNGGTFDYTVTATNATTGCSSTSIPDTISVPIVDVFNPDVSNVATPGVYLIGSLYEGIYTFDVCNTSGTAQFQIENWTSSNNNNTTYTYSWGAGAPVNNFTSATQTPVLGNNLFTITASYLGCTVSETFNIYIGSNPNVSVGVGNTLDLCPGGSTSAAQITPGPLSPGTTYNLYFSNNPGVIVQSFTDITAVTTANPYVFTSGSCGYSVQGNNCIPNNQNVFYAYVIATNACSESCANSTAITVDTPPTAAFTINPTTACTNTNVTVTSNAISGTDISGSASQGFTCSTQAKIKWTISPSTGFTVVNGILGTGNNWSNWLGTPSLTLNFSAAGTYTITQNVQSNPGCGTATISHTVCVVAPPVCAFTPSPLSGCTVLPVTINNTTTGPSCGTPPVPLALAYNWTVTNPAGGTSTVTTASSVSPSIALTNNTTGILTFPINVLVNPLIPGTTNPVPNCSSTCTQTVTVCPQPSFIAQPIQPATVCLDGTFNALSVTVSYLCQGLPSYQWYSNIDPTSSGGILIPGANSASYVPPATAVGTIYYYCVVTFPNNTNCNQIISNNVPAVVVPDPVATATPATQTICVGGTVPNPLTGAYTNGVGTPSYQWNLVGAPTPAISGATLSTYTPPAFASTGTFNYTVTINTSGSGCTASTSAQIAVVVVADPTITVPLATQTLCQNATPTALTVTASGGSGTLQYQWYSNTVNNTTNGTPINGATNSTYTPPTSAVGTLFYYCVVTTPVSGCSVTSAASTVIVIPAPTFTTQPTASNVCVGGTPTQMCVTYINGTGTPSYQWYSNANNNTTGGSSISGATSNCYTPPATAAGTTYYYAIISLTGGGCSVITSNTAAVVITPDPALTTQPTSTQTICVGGSSSALTVALQAATGIGAFTYQWFSNTTATNSNGTLISGATASTYTPAPFTTNGTFYYYCVVTDAGNGCGTVTSQVATVVVVVDPSVTAPLATQTLCQTAAPAPLTVTATGGTGTLLYQWFSNTANNNTSGTLISGATASTYSPPTAIVGTMYYYCVVTTAVSGCSVTSVTAAVIVTQAPNFTTQPVTSTVCVGGTTNQMCVTYANGTGNPAYQWYSNVNNNTTGGSSIGGATSNCYTPPSTTSGTTYYYAIITLTGGGCASITSNTAAVIIAPDPVLTTQPTSTQTICIGGSSSALTVALQASTGIGAFTYQWYSNTTATNSGGTLIGSATAATYAPPVFNTAGTFYYYCVVTDAGNGCGLVTSLVATVVVVADPTVTAPIATQTLCQTAAPAPLTVTASGGTGTLLYQWFSNTANNNTSGTIISGANSATYTPPTAIVGTMYYYCVVTTAASGCSVTSATAAIIVNPAPNFTTQPLPSTVCVGGTTNQMCVTYANGTGTPAYQWYSNTTNSTTLGASILGATADCYTPPSTTAGTNYYYAVITLTGGGCASITSNTAAVIIAPDPVLTTQPTSTQTICVGGSSSALTVALQAATGLGAFTYQWYSNTTASNTGGAAINLANAATYNPPIFNTAGSYYYYCVVTDAGIGCGAVTSQVATVVVVADPTVTAPIATQTLCQTAAPAPLTVTATGGTGTLLYQWFSNTANNNTSGTIISGANSATYTPPTAIVGTMYYYCVVTTAASGCSVTSATAAIIVTQAPTFTTQPATSNVCVDGAATQMCVVYANGTGTAAYQWYSNLANSTTTGTAIPSAITNCYTPPSTTAGTTYYYAVITLTGGGCSSITSNTAAVIISPDPIITTQPTSTQTFCIGGSSVPLTAALQASTGIGAFTYQWFSNTTASNTGGTSIGSATAATYNPPVFNTAGTYYYYCVVTDAGNGCGTVASQVATVVVVADPSISAQPLTTQTLCQTAAPTVLSVTASGGTGTLLYQWYSNALNNVTGGTLITGANTATYTPPTAIVGTVYYYCVITTAASGCSVTSATGAVIVNPAPTFITQPAPSNVCVGGATNQMCVTYANGTGTATYQWYSNAANNTTTGTVIPNETTNCYTPPSATAGTTYYYAIISLAGGGCSSITSNTAEVIITTGTSLSTQPTPSQTICVGGTIPAPLSVSYAGGVGTPTYQWYSSSTAIFGATSSSYTPPTFVSAGTNSYYVTVTLPGAGCGAQTSNTASIVVVLDPTATISANSSYCQNAGNVTPLAVVVSNGQGTPSYQWYSNTTNVNTGGTLISGANAISYSPPVAATGTTYYYCMITQSGTNCAVNSPAAQIIVTPAPTFTSQPTATQSVCVGGATTSFTVAYSNGTGTATYQWYSNATNTYSGGTQITGQTLSSFTPPSATSGTTYYYCIVSFSADGGCSMINSNIAEVVVVADPIISTQPLTTQTICVGGTIPAALNVAYTGGVGTPTYQWFVGTPATSISGASNASYTPPVFNIAGTSNFYATISLSGSGCDALTSANGTVIVVADPTATISSGASYCQNAGSVVALAVVVSDGQGTPSYQWYSNTTNVNTGGTLISGANAISYSPPVAATGTTYYYCLITQSGANCAVNSPTAQIIVTPAPTFTTQPTATQSVCIGGATTPLNVAYSNGTGTATYQWYSNTTNTYAGGTQVTGQTLSSFTPPSTASNTTYYYCIISFSADGGCSMISSEIATVIVVPDPTISTQPLTTQTICVGGTIPVAINVAYAGGLGNPTYQWFGGTPAASLSGATNSSFTPPAFTIPGTYNYYATVGLSGIGCDVLTTANATIIVVADPIVSSQPTVTQSVCQNTPTAQISVSITDGNGSATYQWFSNTTNSNTGGTILVGETLNTFTPPSSVVGTQYYYCVINQTGANCGVTSNPAAVVVNLAPVISTQPLSAQQHCLNAVTNNLQIAYANGTGLPSYQWFVNTTNSAVGGIQINSATNNLYTPPSNIDGTFYYYCVISFVSGGGCPSIVSNVSEVIIHPYPIVTVTGGETICLLESSDINFAFTPSSGLYDITYTANGQSVTLDNYNGANPLYTVTPTLTTTYVITNIAYDQVPQCAIQPNTSIVVVVNPLPALNNTNYTFCSDVATTSLQYIPDANTYTYNWLANTSANYLGQNNGPSVINVTLPNPVGNAPTDFYYVTNLINNATGCQALDSILVTINPNPVGNFTLPTTGCINSPIPLSNGDASIGSYEWSIDGALYSLLANPAPPIFTTLGDHTIEMVAINQYGCTDTLNSVIQIYDQPVANFTTDTDYGCAPLEVNFTNLSTGLFVTSYDWTFAPDTVSWNYQYTSANLVDPPSVTYLQGDVTTIYTATLSVTNACGTVTSQQDITVLPTPVAEFTLATHTICSGSSLVLNNISVGEPLTYYWTYGNTISYNPNLLSMYFPSDSMTYVYPLTLTLTNACGTDTFIDSVTVLPDLVNGGFVTTADAGCSPLTVTLTNTTFNTNLSATWHLDDPLNTVVSNQNTIQFTYYATNNITQTYNPYLVVTDGCASDTIVANLNVFANPLPIISASQSNLCAGTTIDFSGAITGGDTGFGYNWDFGGLGTSNSAAPSFTFPAGSPTGLAIPITLTATSPTFSGTNCSNNATTTIYVYENPDLGPIAFNTTAGCSDLGVTISNLPAATNQINWGDGTTNFNNSHTYINNGPSLLSYNVLVNSTNTYGTIPVLNCSTIANQIVSVYPTPLPQIFSSAINVCEGDNVDFIASTSNNQNTGISYFWNFGTLGTSNNANNSITYSIGSSTGLQTPVQLTAFQNTSGTICSATVTEDVFVYDTPDLSTALYSEIDGCSPLLVSITNLPTSTYTYNWGDGITSTNPNHLYLNQGTTPLNYNVIIDATTFYPTLPLLSCNAVANQIVQVNPQPFAAFTINPDESCFYAPVNTTLENTSQNAIAPYIWNYNGISHTTNSLNYIATFNTSGVQPVELVVSNQFGCTDSVSHDFIIHELPTVTVNAIDDDLCNGASAEFEIDGTGISTSSWNFGDGTTLNLLNPTSLIHYYNQPGVYSITAIVTNIYGCSDTLFFPNEVIVHPSPTASFTTSATTADIVYPYFEFYDNSAGAINYYWNFGDSNWSNEINPTHTYNSEGNYLVELTVTNEYDCFDIATQIVSVEGIVMYVPNAFTPLDYNGVNDVFKPSFSSTDGIEFYEFCIYDRWGIKLFQTNDVDEAWLGNSQEHNPGDDNYYAQNDTYIYTVRYRKKARANDPQPDQLFTGHVTIIR